MKKILILFNLVLLNWLHASEISHYLARLNTYSADFSQQVYQDNQLVQSSKGGVFLKKPFKFRWDYNSPEKMQLISDGKHFYHYDIALAQATSKPAKDVEQTALATLFKNKKAIDQQFSVKATTKFSLKKQLPVKDKKWLDRASVFYLLTPKKNSRLKSQAKRLVLGLTDSQVLTVFYAEDDYGSNIFTFANVKQNPALADDIFLFSPPSGVDILGQ